MSVEIITYDVTQNDGRDSVNGKFIQFYHYKQEVFIFASFRLHQFHNQILNHYLKDQNVFRKWESNEILEYDQNLIKMQGGGKFKVDYAENSLDLYDNSYVYGRFNDTDIKKKFESCNHLWNTYTVNCR